MTEKYWAEGGDSGVNSNSKGQHNKKLSGKHYKKQIESNM